MNKGRLFIVSGPSGSGKDTVLTKVFERKPDIAFSISSITRDMRDGEVEGQKYHFISREEFEKMITDDALLEHNVYVDNYYGTPRKPVEDCINLGGDMIVEVDVNGAAQIREKMPEAVSVFIMPPSFEVLKERLSGRGTETAEQIAERLANAVGEIARSVEYDYIVVNDVLDDAVEDLIAIMRIDRFKADRQTELVNEILNKAKI
ncbi:MAG: guanylate kinase [Ruminococcaceae bacterium]|nr:guanylate kinase [Oscillospiraceae bacterium]